MKRSDKYPPRPEDETPPPAPARWCGLPVLVWIALGVAVIAALGVYDHVVGFW